MRAWVGVKVNVCARACVYAPVLMYALVCCVRQGERACVCVCVSVCVGYINACATNVMLEREAQKKGHADTPQKKKGFPVPVRGHAWVRNHDGLEVEPPVPEITAGLRCVWCAHV